MAFNPSESCSLFERTVFEWLNNKKEIINYMVDYYRIYISYTWTKSQIQRASVFQAALEALGSYTPAGIWSPGLHPRIVILLRPGCGLRTCTSPLRDGAAKKPGTWLWGPPIKCNLIKTVRFYLLGRCIWVIAFLCISVIATACKI